ncbi:hypothetical protein Pd630_LPD03676 [Rhodococcus opacus PD630]|nr:hypothetical protein Pd630_LPD03676 [Rhodococcus opacus PD630]
MNGAGISFPSAPGFGNIEPRLDAGPHLLRRPLVGGRGWNGP